MINDIYDIISFLFITYLLIFLYTYLYLAYLWPISLPILYCILMTPVRFGVNIPRHVHIISTCGAQARIRVRAPGSHV